MKIKAKFILGVTSIVMVVFLLYVSKKKKAEKMLDLIADEGYETAGDILFPVTSWRERRSRKNYKLNSLDDDLLYG